MSKRDILFLIEDILEAASKIKRYTQTHTFQSFSEDEKTIDAVVRNFEIIGEAANRIDPDFKLDNPEIEWKRLRGLRNRIVHEYFGVDLEIVWTIIKDDLDSLNDRLNAIINTLNN
ncbi:Protein of unknown function DUF86, BT0167 group [hydrothermal vent metagenome]|uniref:DUF86 domain-containing protein n=1 Tax=hydrothermal vent metagenome TaxID=652676 RepID=A0A3B0V5V9_9ZZZZ